MNSKMDINTAPKEPKTVKEIQNILITQAKPDNEKSPYFEMARKYKINLSFAPFIRVEPIPSREFRKQKIDIPSFTAIIFNSRNAIDHFFRTCEEMRITVSAEVKYFCITESVALYLQKFILYRKRKVFFADGTNKNLFEVINKYKEQEKFLYPCSHSFDSEITNWLISNNCAYAIPVLYEIISNDVKDIIQKHDYQIICFFTPLGVKSFIENCPSFKQNGTLMGAFGDNTRKAVINAGFHPDILAPEPKAPSMVSALENYLSGLKKK
ncbi:MAG TPA: uroporphyrinogen-III synthase, partial [Hanamia sp.]|jgi:uroporphyrinogen-III synthase|nr:uroporphyrinogen-III synthase [Hanamia sp.]